MADPSIVKDDSGKEVSATANVDIYVPRVIHHAAEYSSDIPVCFTHIWQFVFQVFNCYFLLAEHVFGFFNHNT